MQSTKRIKLGHDSSSAIEAVGRTKTINDLPTDLMKNIFSFVGKGSYYFIGPVSKDFCYNYLTFDLVEDEFDHKLDYIQAIGKNKVTMPDAASTSMELAEHCFLNAPDDFFRELVLVKAALNGRQDIVEMGYALGVQELQYEASEALVPEVTKKGDLEMLQLLYHKYNEDWRLERVCVFRQAAFYGHFDILNWMKILLERGADPPLEDTDMNFIFGAAEGGHKEIIEWLKVFAEDNIAGYSIDERKNICIESAARGGHLELLKWLSEDDDDALRDVNILFVATRSGNLKLIKYLLDHECPHNDPRICVEAALLVDHVKSLRILKFLHHHGVPWDEDTCSSAASRGNLNALIYARRNGCPWDEEILTTTINYGVVPMVEYCLQNNCHFSSHNCARAAGLIDHDHALKVLKVLRKHSVPWDESTCANAARLGNLKVLEWARSCACPWNTKTFEFAIKSENRAVIQYCIENNCPMENVAKFVFNRFDTLSILKILQKNGYTFTPEFCTKAAEKDDIKALRWLRYIGCPWDIHHICNEAVQRDSYDALVYAHKNGCTLTKETYAFCFGKDGLAGQYEEIPSEHICSDEILEYLETNNCPQPDPHDWTIIHYFF